MSTDAIGYILGILTVVMGFIAVRWKMPLLCIAASGITAALLAFVLANTVASHVWHQIIVIALIGLVITFLFMGLMGYRNSPEGRRTTRLFSDVVDITKKINRPSESSYEAMRRRAEEHRQHLRSFRR